MSLMPVPTEQSNATCTSCGAALVADQRYCLACGQPCSPVRLVFLDVLQTEHNRSEIPRTIEMGPAGYAPAGERSGANGWLRRNSGLLGLTAVLLMCLLVGLLVGHWVTQGNKAPGKQVVEVKGLSAAPSAAATTTSPTSTTPTSASKSNAKAEAEEAKAAAKETKAEKAPPPAPVKVKPQTIKKLTTSKGKEHQQEINKLIEGGQPIETG